MPIDVLSVLGRRRALFADDLAASEAQLREVIESSRFLVVGGAGTIGQAVTREIFRRGPKALHVVDLSENNLVELVRGIRSTEGYISGEFKTFAIDFGSLEFESLFDQLGPYDYVLNLAALKHVRSERDPFTLMRMLDVNVLSTEKLRMRCERDRTRKLFCVSTDKATNPVNMMGCSKRIMELFLFSRSESSLISTARFANVAFSDGSLLHGFEQRFAQVQPLSVPTDVRRYFVTKEEAGVLCLLSCLLGAERQIFFPKLDGELKLTSFQDIATRFVQENGFEVAPCESEEEARRRVQEIHTKRRWPIFFFKSDTTGEKEFEEFYRSDSSLVLDAFSEVGIIQNSRMDLSGQLDAFERKVMSFRMRGKWSKKDLLDAFQELVPEFVHEEKDRFLDDRM